MQVRVLSVQVSPDKVEEVENAYYTSLISKQAQQKGYSALLLLWDADTGEALEISFWEDKVDREASEREGGPVEHKLNTLTDILGITPTLKNYQLRIMS
jgi:hypothetical protein